jgi:hypothetical protein
MLNSPAQRANPADVWREGDSITVGLELARDCLSFKLSFGLRL